MDDKLTAEILATCDNIGYPDQDEDKYFKDPNCLECVKDLILYLRRDDDDHSVRRLLGKAQVVQRDLLPLLKHHSEDLELYDVVLRLLVNLTISPLILYDEDVPKNKKYLTQYNELDLHLRAYKTAFVDKAVWKKLSDRLSHLLSLDWEKQMEDDKVALERILVLVRNVLAVAADPAEEMRTDDENTLHDRILVVMHLSGIQDLLLSIASSDSSREYCLHVLEIVSLMLREQSGEQLAKTQLSRNEEERLRDDQELAKIRMKEEGLKRQQMQVFTSSSRHSRFGGTFTVKDMKAPSGLNMLCHKPISSISDLSLDAMKKTKRAPKNRIPMKEDDQLRRSTLAVRIILKEFCSGFLDGAYNSMMNVVRGVILRKKSQEHDETYYLWAMKFFMEFNRFHKFRVSCISETMSINTFHEVQSHLENFHGMMVTDKEKIPFWSKRAHMALQAYQELLYTLLWMDKSGGEEGESTRSVRESSKVIKTNVFYMPEYRELCFNLLNTYEPAKLSQLYLKDLIETNHLFLKMLQDYASSYSGKLVVKTVGKKRTKRKKNKASASKSKKPRRFIPKNEEELEEEWSTFCNDLLSTVEENDADALDSSENVIPFDCLSDTPIEDQKITAVERIAIFLHRRKFAESLTLLKASREVWPDCKEEFGHEEEGSEPVEVCLALKYIFMKVETLPAVSKEIKEREEASEAAEQEEADHDQANNDGEEDYEENDEEFEEEEEQEVQVSSKEQEFDFFGFALKYATSARIISNYALLFKDFENLKPLTLHCIMKMFHRFVFDMTFPAMLCQASVFRTFQKILQVAPYQPHLKETVKFFHHFWPKFVALAQQNKTVLVELLFWKTGREAQEIQEGYGTSTSASGKGKKRPDKLSFTSEEEDELTVLAEEYRDLPDEAKRGTKMVDYVRGRWTYRPKSKKTMMNKLVERGFLDAPGPRRQRAPRVWQDNEIDSLRDLYGQFKDSSSDIDVMDEILPRMPFLRSRKSVIEKMIEIGLIRFKSEVKRRNKRHRHRGNRQDQEDDENGDGPREGVASTPSGRKSRSRSNSRSSRSSSGSRSGSGSSSGTDSGSDSESDSNSSSRRSRQHSGGPSTSEISSSFSNSDKALKHAKELYADDKASSLRWILESLQTFIEDLIEFGEGDTVPLVPIGSDCIAAVNKCSVMKSFMKSLGLQTPGDGESFWRIPGTWNQDATKLRTALIEQVLNSPPSSNDNDDDGGENNVLSGSQSQRRSRLITMMNDLDETEESDVPRSRVGIAGETLSSSPSKILAELDNRNESSHGAKAKKSLKRVIVDSESEDDEVAQKGNNQSDLENSPAKSNISSKNDKAKVSRLLDSDSEDDDDDQGKEDNRDTPSSVNNKSSSKPKRRVFIESDDDED